MKLRIFIIVILALVTFSSYSEDYGFIQFNKILSDIELEKIPLKQALAVLEKNTFRQWMINPFITVLAFKDIDTINSLLSGGNIIGRIEDLQNIGSVFPVFVNSESFFFINKKIKTKFQNKYLSVNDDIEVLEISFTINDFINKKYVYVISFITHRVENNSSWSNLALRYLSGLITISELKEEYSKTGLMRQY